MKPLTAEWVEKAEGDFTSSLREWRARKNPNYDALCFHVQQCVEKYLKAHLQELDQPIPKTHNLLALLELLQEDRTQWQVFKSLFNTIGIYAVAYRYPGESATREIAGEALNACKAFRKEARSVFDLS